ncbi:unknown [Coraliomargarita sp. CAG:312]|nr:unknown [Coraliomargarita sp. CAG:312]
MRHCRRSFSVVKSSGGLVFKFPSNSSHRIWLIFPFSADIELLENLYSLYSIAVAFSRNHPYGIYRPIVGFRIFAAIFYIIPNAQYCGQKLKTYNLVVSYGIGKPTVGYKPVSVIKSAAAWIAKFQVSSGYFLSPTRSFERHWLAEIAGCKHYGRA